MTDNCLPRQNQEGGGIPGWDKGGWGYSQILLLIVIQFSSCKWTFISHKNKKPLNKKLFYKRSIDASNIVYLLLHLIRKLIKVEICAEFPVHSDLVR